jgi:hypothetical protein
MGIDIIPMDEGTAVTGGETFEEMAASMPESAKTGFDVVNPAQQPESNGDGFGVFGGAESSEPTPERKVLKMSRKMKAAMKKIQDKVSSFPILYFKGKAKVHPEWALDQDEEEIISDSLTFLFEVLDVNFNIQPLNVTLESIWWVIAYPVCAIGMIFFSHSAAVKANHPEDFQEEKK